MTSEELDERLKNILGLDNWQYSTMPHEVEQLIRDCIEAVKNGVTQTKRHHTDERADWCGSVPTTCVCEEIRDEIEANAKELLGDK